VVRTALLALAVIIGLSIFLTSRPIPVPPLASKGVRLENVKLTLYPEQDPKAKWEFAAGQVEQDPASREAKVSNLQSGQRYVDNKLDLRLWALEITIDRQDNLRVPYARAEILDGCLIVELGGAGEQPVLIDQRQGFNAPSVKIDSPSLVGTAKGFKSDFQIVNIESPSPSFEFRTGDEKGPCKVSGGKE